MYDNIDNKRSPSEFIVTEQNCKDQLQKILHEIEVYFGISTHFLAKKSKFWSKMEE